MQPVKTKKKLSRADKKQIEAAIARANRTDKKGKSAQDSIPYERMWPDGICRVSDSHYTKTIQFQDINYQLSQNEDKTAIFEGWCDFLNYFDSSIHFQLSFLNLAASEETFANSISIPPQRDAFDSIREEYTTMRNVAGLSTSDAQKSSDMFAKCRYMDEITGNRGVIFATGTPVSNSMTELYTMQRYLQYERLQELNMTHFDCWASRFGETVTALELAPEGTGYRARTRFSKFFNLPELMNLFKEVADIKTADQLNLPTPEVEYHNIVAQPTEHQQEMVKALSERASLVHSGTVDPSQDNMLKITSDGRKLGLDQRIVNQMLPDEPGTKVNQCVDNIMQIWRDGDADKLTQLVFCDISTPQAKAPASKAAKTLDNPLLHALEGAVPLPEQEPAFTVYDDIRQKLIAQGMPADQIAFIHEANTEVRKKELFSKVRTGQVRVLMGSTAKMGAGTNVQDRLVALHDLDCPWVRLEVA